MRAALLATALLLAPVAQADDACRPALGRGWPSATENYGTAVEDLLAAGRTPGWRVTLLPANGVESGVMLVADPAGGDWTLRHAIADERVKVWTGGRLEMRTHRQPEVEEATIPATVAQRLVDEWGRMFETVAPEGSEAPFSENAWSFVVATPDGEALRVSGPRPECELGELMRDQIDLLIEASEEGEEKRAKRWRQLGESLDRMRDAAQALGPAAQQ